MPPTVVVERRDLWNDVCDEVAILGRGGKGVVVHRDRPEGHHRGQGADVGRALDGIVVQIESAQMQNNRQTSATMSFSCRTRVAWCQQHRGSLCTHVCRWIASSSPSTTAILLCERLTSRSAQGAMRRKPDMSTMALCDLFRGDGGRTESSKKACGKREIQ